MICEDLAVAIARAVEKAGGTMEDVDDLIAVWERLDADRRGRVDRIRHEAATVLCCCGNHDELTDDGRCSRCYGVPAQ